LEGKVPVAPELPQTPPRHSSLAIELEQRLSRTPRSLATTLAKFYGHELREAVYIPAVACMARLRLGALGEVEALAAPFVDGRKDSLVNATGSHLSGHLLFAALFERTRNRAYLDRVLAAADLGFDEKGHPRECMPYHNEMSDAVFMGCPILGYAGKLTGERKYHDMAVRHLRFMEKLCLRQDGLYRHSPLNEAAWGRGNAFPALGMALLLETMARPDTYTLEAFRSLIRSLARRQDGDGLWHQVVDRADSYAEFTATAMIAVAIRKGIRNGWLGGNHRPIVDRAWQAILARTWDDGVFLDVCESTGKQKTMEDYFNRGAIWDKDPRGGAMALLLATEMVDY
jgi:rhamnogalacturonyl hydrolase YesR